ncbi:cellulase family glycosylhydrolase [Dysgonomonas sp. Marseille-P4677]|uniref:cellulase family glycosylhydrolase n=1 Tax=Dysgonomonas sp. Marseille-P4677 TaxID=2364790 RepID=UPI001913695F|nr:cellulase family glycosylhydrolase [Dysgonomonas sp. Marseille-P4677]MBK5721052.1 cellulase family glycosylhydrolase [Dysgonomonas sp. Marseille-P4677]
MKLLFVILCCLSFTFSAYAQKVQSIPTIYIDKSGTMRWSDTQKEASFYGVNYTLPFAHAYRAINYIGKSHKEAIDKDVYHFSRLGFNAYRIHVWDVEISNGDGQLIENEHLDLLDYLIAKLRERNIRVLITTMTNFGNGYPERNENNGAFSYLYDKCKIHSDKKAINAQANYISQFVKHMNPYTQQSYKDDPYIVGFEINNEPCHMDTPQQTEDYINRMLSALEKAGNSKPIFYNVSHNMPHVQAYFNTKIQGTTYQWYPIGLVAGQTRKGNFLPYVDTYNIPFDNIKGFDKKAKAVYEYDPADITYSYMYPAMTRTFRSQRFQWITQFAYDPIDIAWANTEYQTHFLNLAYTPGKAISMKIAAEIAYNIPMNRKYAKYPNDTIFDAFRVSYEQDLSEMNTPEKFFYSNNTNSAPVMADKLESIAGCGNSPLIKYEGTGAYFIDKLEDGLWRLEVMPDAIQINDPFSKPSLKKEVVTIAWNEWNMEIRLPDLGENFTIATINKENASDRLSNGASFLIKPGVYLLTKNGYTPVKTWNSNTKWNNITLGEFVAPEAHAKIFSVVHQPAKVVETNKPLNIEAQIVGPSFPDSVIIYTDKVSFWSATNPYIKMKRKEGYTYQAQIPTDMITSGIFRYNIIVCKGKQNYTFPGQTEGNPLDWDYIQNKYWESKVVDENSPVQLIKITNENKEIETYAIPETSYILKSIKENLTESNSMIFNFKTNDTEARFFWRKYIKDDVNTRKDALMVAKILYLNIKNAIDLKKLKVGFVTSDGFTYTTALNLDKEKQIYEVRLSDLIQDKTILLPAPYPTFLERSFTPDTSIPFDVSKIEIIQMSTIDNVSENTSFELGSIWLK